MGDQFFYRTDGGSNTADLIEYVESRGLSAGLYGVQMPIDNIDSSIEKDADGNFVRIVEKPQPGEAPTDLQNASFYLFDKTIFEFARTLPANPKRGEYEVTDAINAYVASGKKVAVGTVNGQYMECGSVEGWLNANNVVLADIVK
jgi:dTDP-glucose pyrophosphorylase